MKPPRAPSRTIKHVRFYVALSASSGYRIIDQDDRFSTWIDQLSAVEAMSLCKLLNEANPMVESR